MNQKNKLGLLFLGISLALPVIGFQLYDWYSQKYAELPLYDVNSANNPNPSIKPNNTFYVPSFQYLNQDSQLISSATYLNDKIWVGYFFFSHCATICPQMTKNVSNLQKRLTNNQDIKLMAFTVDPESDSPSRLKQYAALFKANTSQWQFLTGSKTDLYKFARKGMLIVATDGDGGPNDFIHSERLVLVDKQKRIRGYYDGTDKEQVERLYNDIIKLSKSSKP
jgi:protein SCO1/2